MQPLLLGAAAWRIGDGHRSVLIAVGLGRWIFDCDQILLEAAD
jgi:hypothetical protein